MLELVTHIALGYVAVSVVGYTLYLIIKNFTITRR